MSKDPKKTAQAAGPVVYCGPTIPGVAVQFHTGAGRYYTLYRKAQGNG